MDKTMAAGLGIFAVLTAALLVGCVVLTVQDARVRRGTRKGGHRAG